EDDEYDDTVQKDYVVSQSPEGNTTAAKGTTVRIVVSKGKEVKVFVVPDLKKKTITEAESALSEVNLKLGNVTQEYSESIKEGQVISQSIAAGTEVKESTAVDITISKGKKPTTTTYTVSFSGSISNNGYDFEEGEFVRIKVTLIVGGASYTIVDDVYDEAELPLSLSNAEEITGLVSKDGTLIYSVQNEAGNDITSSFSSNSVQARFRAVEQ
ncbi:MAG: PASTA domain-containing protein, partial [Lachnospiraceae bacterium]|nr:PASTA domain-containing protein [Lachnospiraceae bacterium]